jgi:hypothetical protein
MVSFRRVEDSIRNVIEDDSASRTSRKRSLREAVVMLHKLH